MLGSTPGWNILTFVDRGLVVSDVVMGGRARASNISKLSMTTCVHCWGV